MALAKFQGNRLRIDGEIGQNHAILVYIIKKKKFYILSAILTKLWPLFFNCIFSTISINILAAFEKNHA